MLTSTCVQVAVTVEERIYAPEKSIFVPEKCVVALKEEFLTTDTPTPRLWRDRLRGWYEYEINLERRNSGAEEIASLFFHPCGMRYCRRIDHMAFSL